MKNISDKILIIILAVIVCVLLFKSCESQNDYDRLANALEISDLNNQKFKKEITKKGVEISDLDAREHVYGMPYSEWKKKYQK